jgi:hypothetical protein
MKGQERTLCMCAVLPPLCSSFELIEKNFDHGMPFIQDLIIKHVIYEATKLWALSFLSQIFTFHFELDQKLGEKRSNIQTIKIYTEKLCCIFLRLNKKKGNLSCFDA